MSPILSTEPVMTKIVGLSFDHFFAPPAASGIGTPVLMDKDQDAWITLADGASVKNLLLFTEANAILGLQLAENAVEISTEELKEGSVVEIDNVPIGTVVFYNGQYLEIDFIEATTAPEIEALRLKVEKLIRALTFTNLDETWPSPERMVSIIIEDSMGQSDDASVLVADRIHGDENPNFIEIDSVNLSWGDEIVGGAGSDTLKLKGGGLADFTWLSKFEGIETILGSDAKDTIYMFSAQIEAIDSIDGGGQVGDRLHISGDAIDLRGIGISGFSQITYGGVGTTIIVDSISVAKMLNGDLADEETLTIIGGDLTDAQRLEMHRKGIDYIVHNGRRTTLADVEGPKPEPVGNKPPSGLVLDKAWTFENAAGGTVIGTLGARDDDGDPLTYTLTDDAGGRFEIRGDKLVVKAGEKLDYEATSSHKITVKVSDTKATVAEDFIIRVADMLETVHGATKGKNTLKGGIGMDRINGGSGNDKLMGGAGADQFVFNSKLGKGTTKANQNKKVNFDTITDFKRGEDKILLDNAIFKKLGKGSLSSPGALNKKFFKAGTKAGDKNDYLIYNKKTGIVYYDADGSGTKYKPVEFIKLSNKAALSASDFLII